MNAVATIRDMHGNVTETNIVRELDTRHQYLAMATVIGIGIMAIRKTALGWKAFLVQGEDFYVRDIKWVDGNAEVEVLPNPSGEDRIVVVFGGLEQ